ncbi:ATP-binding cassette domain-containing protein [candidate division KSB3 bacterium]|uniref:ATP-binding cassette domain-containing protein n=1 Tax=candidate division KSB3 bacterium TaxID=2044937 RepID=A0A9D5JVA3_9BACT|nr:ATP-binding cassette domain-containing protein [candidate division KSB3 bacterium]MBD3324805.1 ATP-binding cassette domain-containing protein [candidate division KSB3 bacterium]
MSTAVEFRGITKSYAQVPVLQDVNLTIETGTFTVIYGVPACGKSVLVRLLTGLEHPDSGQIFLRGQDVGAVEPGARNIGYVPQMFALYPHYRVYDNIAYPLSLMKVPKEEIDATVHEVAKQIKIDHLLEKYPDQLSGGEKQRVALARGVVKHTDVYALDDPLVGLDFKLREQLFDDLRDMQESLQATFVYTTSDPLETLALADHVAILDGGRIAETGPIEEVYRTPRHVRSMELLGFPASNLLSGHLAMRDDRLWCQAHVFDFPVQPVHTDFAPAEPTEAAVVIRPQAIVLDTAPDSGMLQCQAHVVLRDDLGGEWVLYLDVEGTSLVTVVPHAHDQTVSQDVLTIGVYPSDMAVFAPDTGEHIGYGAA